MKVKELIEILKTENQELEVWVDFDGVIREAKNAERIKNDNYNNPYDVIIIE